MLTGDVLNDAKVGLAADRIVIGCSGVGVGVGAELWMVIGVRAMGRFSWFRERPFLWWIGWCSMAVLISM